MRLYAACVGAVPARAARCDIPPQPIRVSSGTPVGRFLRHRIQAMKNNAAICRLRRGRPGQGGPL